MKKLYRVLQFRQEQWLAPYSSLNSQKRQLATNKFEENFYKLMNIAVYGKNCESKRRRNKLVIRRDAESTLSTISKFEFERYIIFGENLAALSTRPKKNLLEYTNNSRRFNFGLGEISDVPFSLQSDAAQL